MAREIIGVFGKTGFGKSLWAGHYTRYKKRLLVYDPYGDGQWDTEFLDTVADIEGVVDTDGTFAMGVNDVGEVDALCELGVELGDCYILLEEFSTIADKGATISDALRKVIFQGRHDNVSLVVVAQRPMSIPIDLRSQITRVVSFRQTDNGGDLSFLQNYFSGGMIKDLSRLPILVCLDSRGDGQKYGIEVAIDNGGKKAETLSQTDFIGLRIIRGA